MEKIRVMFYADCFKGTSGYSRVARELSTRLAKMPEFSVYFQELITQTPARSEDGVRILPAFAQRGTDMYLNVLVNHLRIFGPHVFIPIGDTFLLKRDGLDRLELKNIDIIPYVMIDSEGLPDYSIDVLKNISALFTGSKHGQEQLATENIKSEVLFHGVDYTKYKPATKAMIKLFRKDWGYPEDKKIFLTVGRNFLRKRPQRLLEIIARFNKANPDNDCFFVFHTADAEAKDWNLPLFIKRMEKKFNVSMNNVVFTDEHRLGEGIEESDLISLYQLSDYYITASSGEGFGLPIIEAMACKKLVIAPDNTTHSVFLDNNRGILVENTGKTYTGFGTYQKLVDIDKFVEALEKAMNMNRQDYDKISNAGMAWVKENCNWDEIAKQLATTIIEVQNDKKRNN